MQRNRFHSLCPYFAMFPESFVEDQLQMLTKRGDLVLDPFCGRGTTPFTSLLNERRAIGCDINDVAYCVSQAKVASPARATLIRRIDQLEDEYADYSVPGDRLPTFFYRCYEPRTLRALLYLRSTLRWRRRKSDRMIAALVLGSLHGETNSSSSYLSNQMPRTISPKPAYSIRWWEKNNKKAPRRDVFALLRDRIDFRYSSPRPEQEAKIVHGDFRHLPEWFDREMGSERARVAITSPPYFDVTNFEEDQWLRLWFLGGPPHPTSNRLSQDNRTGYEVKYWNLISDMWRTLGRVISKTGHVVIRIGSRRIPPERLAQKLEGCAIFSGRRVELISSTVSELKRRQTDRFRPGSRGVQVEIDCHFRFRR